MNKCFFKLLLCFLFLFASCLSGCTHLSDWKKNPQSVKRGNDAEIHTWTLTGKISIQTPTDSKQAFFYWQQNNNRYHIRLFGPLGMGGIELTGCKNDIRLSNSQGKLYQARSPEALLKQQLGFTLPIANLQYWIRGLPAPNLPVKVTPKMTPVSHPETLVQQNWKIHYLSYQDQSQNHRAIPVPRLIKLIYPASEHEQMKLTIMIDSYLTS